MFLSQYFFKHIFTSLKSFPSIFPAYTITSERQMGRASLNSKEFFCLTGLDMQANSKIDTIRHVGLVIFEAEGSAHVTD